MRPLSSRRGQLVLIAVLVAAGPPFVYGQTPKYPAARRVDVVDDYHGVRVADPYRWLETSDAPETRAWLRSERRVTAAVFARLGDREAIRRRLDALWSFPRTEVPWRVAGRLFFLANTGTEAQPVLFSTNGVDRAVVLDPNAISDGSVAVRDFTVSPDGRWLAYATARGGSDLGETHVREIATGREVADVVRGVLTSVGWTHDGRGFFYVRPPAPAPGEASDAARIGKQVYYHVVGRPQASDRLVLEWKENARWVYFAPSEDGRWMLVVAEEGTESEMVAIDLGDPDRPDVAARPVRLLPGTSAFSTHVDVVGKTLYVRTNLDAPKGRVIALDLTEGASAAPRAVVPESSEVILDAVVAGDRLVVQSLADVISHLRLVAFDGTSIGEVELPGIGAVEWPLAGRPSSPELFFAFTSFLAPSTVYRSDVRTGTRTPCRPPNVPFDPSEYETRQVFCTSKDGTRVPMFVTAAKGLTLDGTHPTMLTGYGGYGDSREPAYEPDVPLWLEMGGVYAVANIRGGGEYGEAWHRAGMLERKQNSFDDFAAAAESLVASGYTSPGKLAIYGRSNGGLLIGASITQRPDLFAAAVADAGHYDMLRYHRFTVGAGWISEFGSPDDPAAFPFLRAYSPLHNVRAGTCYPATLLLAADHDDRVVPSHAYKFTAALQAAQGCDRPVVLRVAANASHSYASRQAQIDERADMWAFVAARLGARIPPTRNSSSQHRLRRST